MKTKTANSHMRTAGQGMTQPMLPNAHVCCSERAAFVLRVVALLMALVMMAAQGFATRRDVSDDCKGEHPDQSCKEPKDRHSYVRSSKKKLVLTDEQFAKDVKGAFGGASVDIVATQCHAGGFLSYVDQIGKPYTITTSAAWQETTWYFQDLGNGYSLTYLENFTRPWSEDVLLNPTRGLFDRFRLAAGAGVTSDKIKQDRFAPPGFTDDYGTYVERPQYQSPDKETGGPNDSRPLLAAGKGNRYAILVQWQLPAGNTPPADRFAVNISRLRYSLKKAIGVPVDNIVVLYSDSEKNTVIGPFENISGDGSNWDKLDLGYVVVDGPNTRKAWLAAIKGQLFGANWKGITYGPDDQLFIYFTGHGGNEATTKLPKADEVGLNYQVELEDSFNTLDMGDPVTDADGNDLLQISTTALIDDPEVEITVNGAPFGPLQRMQVTDPDQIYDLGDFVKGQTYTYQLRIPNSLLATNPQYASIGISNVSDSGLVAAFIFAGGDQEYMAVVSDK